MSHVNFELVVSLLMIPFTAFFLYMLLVAPEKRLQYWAKKRGFTILMSDDESSTERLDYIRDRYRPTLFRVRVRDVDGVVKTGTVRVYDDYAEESWEVDQFVIFRF